MNRLTLAAVALVACGALSLPAFAQDAKDSIDPKKAQNTDGAGQQVKSAKDCPPKSDQSKAAAAGQSQSSQSASSDGQRVTAGAKIAAEGQTGKPGEAQTETAERRQDQTAQNTSSQNSSSQGSDSSQPADSKSSAATDPNYQGASMDCN